MNNRRHGLLNLDCPCSRSHEILACLGLGSNLIPRVPSRYTVMFIKCVFASTMSIMSTSSLKPGDAGTYQFSEFTQATRVRHRQQELTRTVNLSLWVSDTKNEQRTNQVFLSSLIRRLQGHGSHRCNVAKPQTWQGDASTFPIGSLMCFSATLRLYLMFTVLEAYRSRSLFDSTVYACLYCWIS